MLVNVKILEDHWVAKSFGKGVYRCSSFNMDSHIWDRSRGHASYEMKYPRVEGVGDYGVVDTPEQFVEDFLDRLEKDPRPLVVCFTHIAKEPENKGRGDGWRWHKWGQYVGHGNPQCEYLDDEDGFDDGVWVYHIYHVEGIETC